MAGVGYHVRQAMGGVRASFVTALVAAVAIGVALAALGAGLVVARSLEATLRTAAASARVTVFLPYETSDDEGAGWAEEVRKVAGDEAEVVYVPPAEALDRLARELGEGGLALRALAVNPLPPTIEARMTARQGVGPDGVRALVARITRLPFAQDVDWGEGFVAGLERMLQGLRVGLAAGGALVLALLLFLVGNVVALTVHARRDEIAILRLVGATDGFIVAPFVIEGAIQGAVGGALAGVLLSFGQALWEPALAHLMGVEALPLVVVSIGGWVFALPFVGALVGALGSLWSSWRYLRAAA